MYAGTCGTKCTDSVSTPNCGRERETDAQSGRDALCIQTEILRDHLRRRKQTPCEKRKAARERKGREMEMDAEGGRVGCGRGKRERQHCSAAV